jgi:serine/threonine protein kinase
MSDPLPPTRLEPPATVREEADLSGATAQAPPCPAPVPPPGGPLLGLPRAGQRVDDFELVRLLGSGSFARVFLARQVSLGRQVALKVSVNRGNEARTLAILEHDHIVRVFSEVVDAQHDLRLLCMQYVPGTTLERVITTLARQPDPRPSGKAVLAVIDAQASDPAPLDLAALRDRQLLGELDAVETACWLGARLAEALAHAHGQGVLHRDVKPANILLNRYGRPLLVDFNVATTRREAAGQPLGGTLAYMSPEHLDAFAGHVPADEVGPRGDVYSLGVVLYELLAGRLPAGAPGCAPGNQARPPEAALAPEASTKPGHSPDLPGGGAALGFTGVVRSLSAERRAGPPLLPEGVGAPPALERVIARCLAPAAEDRYTAAELADALESCRELRRAQCALPRGRLLTRLALARPFLFAGLLVLLPHVLGTAVNIGYNALRIVHGTLDGRPLLTEAQRGAFPHIVVAYNLVVWPLCLVLLFRQWAPVWRTWRQLSGCGAIDDAAVARARNRALKLPAWAVVLSCVGWLPGGLVFPLAVEGLAGPAPAEMYARFLFSFTVSGLIALTYSVIAVEFVVVRVLYPGLWLDGRELRRTAPGDLERADGRLAALQFLAVLIPVAGAALLLGVGPENFSPASYNAFRQLVTALLALGMVGLGLAILARSELRQAVAALTGPGRGGTGVGGTGVPPVGS